MYVLRWYRVGGNSSRKLNPCYPWTPSSVKHKWQTRLVPQPWKWTASGASPPILIGRSHHSSICPAHLKALNIPRLKRPQPQGQRLREWLPFLESEHPILRHPLSHFYSTPVSLVFSLFCFYLSIYASQSFSPSLPLSCICIFTRVHITGVWGRVRSSGEGKPLGE